ncbi:MAG TPA: GNAT family N-acetyltransferase [Reyranellaceae bacterium]|nr:GNAT family N-acetyltransferase [Reyranellaceae bacterium]
MRLSARTLVVHEADIAAGRVLVAAGDDDRALGVVCVQGDGDTVDLADMFVDPPSIGTGAGKALFEAAVGLARGLGAGTLTILADPHAAPFYERMGARFVRMAPSDAIPGRQLPFYELALR